MARDLTGDPWLRRLDERFERIDARFDSIERTMRLGLIVIYTTMFAGFTATLILLAIKI